MLFELAAVCIALAPAPAVPPARYSFAAETVEVRKHSFEPGLVPGWSGGAAGGADRVSYRVETDLTVKHGGESSGHLGSGGAVPERGFGMISQLIRADDYRGKRIRYTAYIKANGVVGRGVTLWIRVDANNATFSNDNRLVPLTDGNTDWVRISSVTDVPADAIGFSLGVLLLGTGEVWVDDASVEIVGTDVSLTAPPFAPTQQQYLGQERNMYSNYGTNRLVNGGFEPRP